MIGQTVSHYEILEKLGEGGMGVVYKARDTRLNRIVALKFLPARLVGSPEQVARFEQEARAISALNHPHIATIHDIGEANGDRFLVLEYIPGGTLKSKIRGQKLSREEILLYALQVAEALAHAHRRGIVHRDVKAENVMLTEEGGVKITDFGLAKLIGGEELTQAGHTVGTAAYMSPEQAQGIPVDHRSDIFSFGILLYEMAMGELPFRGSSGMATLYEIVNKPAPGLEGDVGPIVARALEKDRDARYQTMDEIVGHLRGLSTGATASATAIDTRTIGAQARPPAVAVIPFANLSADPENEYFSDGLTEDLISALSQLEGLRVVARTSAFQFKGKAHDIREIGRQLNVNSVLEGSVRRAGEKVRVTAQLVNVTDGYHLWSDRYDREMKDVFAIQDEISRAIVKALRVKLVGGDERPLVKNYAQNLEGYRLLLQGRYHWNKFSEEGFRKGIENYSRAIAADPGYAPAYAGLADCFNLLGFWGVSPPQEVMPNAKALAMKALELDESLAEAHSSLGNVAALYDWDWAVAEREFRRAVELNPGYATAHLMFGICCLVPLGRIEEGLAELRRAQELDPLSLVINTCLGAALGLAGRNDAAIEQYQKTLDLDPHFSEVFRCLGWAYLGKSMHQEAIAAFEDARKLSGGSSIVMGDLGYSYGLAGKPDNARELIRELAALSKQTYVSAYPTALIHLGLGDYDAAFEWLEKACQERSGWLIWLKVGPALDPVRSDPRLLDLRRRVGLGD